MCVLSFRRVAMRELIYPGDRLLGMRDIHFGKSLLFTKSRRIDNEL